MPDQKPPNVAQRSRGRINLGKGKQKTFRCVASTIFDSEIWRNRQFFFLFTANFFREDWTSSQQLGHLSIDDSVSFTGARPQPRWWWRGDRAFSFGICGDPWEAPASTARLFTPFFRIWSRWFQAVLVGIWMIYIYIYWYIALLNSTGASCWRFLTVVLFWKIYSRYCTYKWIWTGYNSIAKLTGV